MIQMHITDASDTSCHSESITTTVLISSVTHEGTQVQHKKGLLSGMKMKLDKACVILKAHLRVKTCLKFASPSDEMQIRALLYSFCSSAQEHAFNVMYFSQVKMCSSPYGQTQCYYFVTAAPPDENDLV